MRNVPSVSLFALFLLALPHYCTAYTYWVDESCSKKPGWDTALKEAFMMARKAHDRLSSNTDKDFAAVFKRIFKVDKDDDTQYRIHALDREEDVIKGLGGNWEQPSSRSAFGHVKAIVGSIANDWTKVETEKERLMSDIRFYCDQDKRWVSRDKGSQEYMYDYANYLRAKKASLEPPKGCESEEGILARTYTNRNPTKKAAQNVWRCAITMCDRLFERNNKKLLLWKDWVDENARTESGLDLRLLPGGIGEFDLLIAGTIFHEMTHFPGYSLRDIPPHPYGFRDVMNKNTDDNLNNADTYTQLGLFALVADIKPNQISSGGYTLPRTLDSPATEEQKKEAEENESKALKGMLELYDDLTKRWLNVVAKAFWS